MIQFLPYVAVLVVISAMALSVSHALTWRVVALHAVLMLTVLAVGVDVMGRPKPLWAEIRDVDEIEVAAAIYHPGEGIYVWARTSPPVAYRLPWNVLLARKMQEGERESGGTLLSRGQTDGGEWTAHPLPQAPDKPKDMAR